MNISKRKTKTTVITLFLMFAMAISLVALPTGSGQAPTKQSFAIIGALPNPVGVGQETLILAGITHQTLSIATQPGWEDVTVTVERPDGTTETLGPVMTDTTGMTGITFSPDVAGTYYLQTNFPEQELLFGAAGTPAGTIMLASTSDKLQLVVTEEPREFWPGVPLPTEYWTRPIDSQLREWSPIAGNWLNVVSYNRLPPNNDDAPETAHLLWAKVLDEGGLVGGVDQYAVDMNNIGYEHGDAYSGKFQNPVIINGILFYNEYPTGFMGDTAEQRVIAVDIHTGEVLWRKVLGNNERLAFGQTFYWQTYDMYGAFSYLWTTVGSTWNAYAPLTGRLEYTMENVPSGNRIVGPMGEILIYTVNQANGWMTMWNSSNIPALWGAPSLQAGFFGFLAGAWYPWGKTVDAVGPVDVTPYTPLGLAGYMWNVTIPTGLPGSVDTVLADRIIGSNTAWSGGNYQPNPEFWAISTKPGQEGYLLFNKPWNLPVADVHVDIPGSHPASVEDGVFVVAVKELRTYYGLSIDTGTQLWGPTSPAEPYLNVFTNLYMDPWGQSIITDGKLFTAGMGGVVNAYDTTNGEHLWRYNITDPFTEQLFSENWPAPINFIVDGKVYLFHQEHSGNTPLPRGAPGVCLNATTGEEIWRIDGLRLGTRWGGQPIIGDSIITALSSYDNRIVAIGKGPSATTVSIQNDVTTHGNSVLATGMVTDISPGTNDVALTMRFPHGVPAVSDESMSDWMLYVYQQFPRPAATGVEVVLSVLDPNNNLYEVGRTTNDATGNFVLEFTPEVPGLYTVIATFEGSKAYYGSFAETFLKVNEAPPLPQPEQPITLPPTETYIAAATIAIIIAIAIVGLLILRKR